MTSKRYQPTRSPKSWRSRSRPSSPVCTGHGSTSVKDSPRSRGPPRAKRRPDEARGYGLPRPRRRHLPEADSRLPVGVRRGHDAGGGTKCLPPSHRDVSSLCRVPIDLRGDRPDAEALEASRRPARPRQGRRLLRPFAPQRQGMTRASLVRLALFALAGLALFSLLFSLAADNGLWPRLPAGALHGRDLWAGLFAGVTLLLFLLRGGTQRTGGRGDGGTGSKKRE